MPGLASKFLCMLPLLAGCGTPLATVKNAQGEPVMLLGFDPVAYFTDGRPVRGSERFKSRLPPDAPTRTYFFASEKQKRLFDADPARYEPQYGGFCSSGAAYGIKLSSDPTSWEIHEGRLFIFGDIIGKMAWQLEPKWNVMHADSLWPEIKDAGWRAQSLKRYLNKVPHYKTGAELTAEWQRRNPGATWPPYDPGGMLTNLFLKPPGWRAAEGYGQPALGYPE